MKPDSSYTLTEPAFDNGSSPLNLASVKRTTGKVWRGAWPVLLLGAVCAGLFYIVLNFFNLAYELSTPLMKVMGG